MWIILTMTGKFLIQIHWFHLIHRHWDRETKEKWNSLLIKQAKEYRRVSVKLGGLLIKFGQFLSTRKDLLPQAFIKQLQGLTDKVSPIPFAYSKKIIEEEWEGEINDYIKELDEKPVASASIGEVYHGVLKDGTSVAVKVQRYRVEEIFHMDFRALRIVFWLLARFTSFGKKADLKALHKEIIFIMSKELDFSKELKYARHFEKRFKENKSVSVPTYYDSLSTSRVLVMEWIKGAKADDLSFIESNQIDRKQVAKTLFHLYVDQFINPGFFHADPHAANIILRKDGSVVIIDFGMIGEITKVDSRHLRNIVHGVILDDYERVIHSLQSMDFVLEHADNEKISQVLRNTLNMYKGDSSPMDGDAMDQVMEDIQFFVNEQPIQLPADYAFLGRAASIILGVLTSVYPEIDVEEWGRPVVKKWASGENGKGSVYTEVFKESTKPFLSMPRQLADWLNDGEKDREWEKNKQRYKFMHHFYLFYASISFFLIVTSGSMLVIGHFLESDIFFNIGAITATIFLLVLLVLVKKHSKMIRSLENNRRFW